MRIKLTLRYLMMVLISTVLLIVSAFFVLTYIEETMDSSAEKPITFAYNFGEEIELNSNRDVEVSEGGLDKLIAEEAWLQILDEEGYVIGSYNTPDSLADHYSPIEITNMGASESYRLDHIYEVGKTSDDINYLIGMPAGDWFNLAFEMDKGMIRQFGQIMLVLTFIILLVMGFLFSRRIAKPVTQIIRGVEGLSDEEYKSDYVEKGLYVSVFRQLNKLASRLQSSEIERQKTKVQREKWISNISHDLKTPLSTIKGYSEILSDLTYELSPDEIKKYSETIQEKSLYMEEMIEELRLNERLMHDGIILNKVTENLTTFIREIIIDSLNHPDYSERTIEFNPGDENILYSFDKELLKRAIENLIYNALIHNEQETIVTVSLVEQQDNILIEIKDNGRGMTQEELEQLFNRYYRGMNTKNYKGTGLGMSIAKEVIEAHDGEIDVESEIDKGTKIKIIL